MIGAFGAIAVNGFREARRNRVTVVVGVFALALLLASSLVTEVTVGTLSRVLTDVGLGAMSWILVLLAIFLSSGLLSREIEKRTIFLIVSKPISRAAFLVGKLAGNMLTLAALLVAMTVFFCIQSVIYNSAITQPQMVACVMLFIELLVLTSIGFVMSSFSSQLVSAVVTTGIFFAGHLSTDIYNLSDKAKSPIVQVVGKIVYYILPNLERFNYRPAASYGVPVPAEQALSSVAYGVFYATLMVALSVILFRRRDFR